MEKTTRKRLGGRDFYLLLVLVLSCNMVLWLDSFDRYLSSRYHFYLSQYLPDAAYAPSEHVQQALGLGGGNEQTADDDEGSDDPVRAAIPAHAQAQAAQLRTAPALPASAVIVQGSATAPPGSAPVQTGMAGAALAAASAPAQVQVQAGVQPASAPAANGNDNGPGNTLAAADSGPKILFAGDSMMQGVAPIVISRLRKLYPHGLFVDVSKESTGLTVNRYFDWPTKIRDECVRQGLRTVVIFLGPNDPWDIYEHRKRYAFPSEKWEAKYRSRVDEVLDFAAAQGMRVIWIGLPVMREDRIQQGARIENKIFQEETRKYKFDYLPTEDLLGSLDQPYRKYIDDPRKGKVVVRADDGVHFTSTGLRMISSRVEELLRKQGKL